MTSEQWKKLMRAWSGEVMGTELVRHLGEGERGVKYLGFKGASEKEVAALEKRIGVGLPQSYRAFLKGTDGFRVMSPFIYRLRPAAEVDWFRVENEGWAKIFNEPTIYDDPDRPETLDEEYFDYKRASEVDLRSSHLFAMLQISDVGDGVMLLNPLVVTPDGEWEAWFFATWIPGAKRYSSFAHMMVETYRSMRELEKLPEKPKLPVVKVPGPKVPRHSVVELPEIPRPRAAPKRQKRQSQLDYIVQFMEEVGREEVTPAPKELVKLLNDLKSADKKVRAKTIRILHGKLVGHPMATRHPDLVPLAAELARTLPEVESRCVCVSLLTDITPDGPVPEWLMTALGDTDQSVQWAALYAIHWFKGPELVDLVIKIVRNVMNPLFAVSAADSLSEFPDARAIPELAALLERTLPSEVPVPAEMHDRFYEQQYTRIALALAKYGVPAVSKLTALLGHADRNRRFAAIVGLRAIGEAESRKAVAALKSDTDAGVRDQAEICDAIWGNAPGFEMHEMK